MQPSSYGTELPLSTLDMRDLLMQFKVMRALGYHSLFDADFRRELRNPLRRMLYYRLVNFEESARARLESQIMKSAADRIGFYSNPEMAKKIAEQEEQDALLDPEVAKDTAARYANKYEEALKSYTPMDAATLSEVRTRLKE